jgi:tricorn protease
MLWVTTPIPKEPPWDADARGPLSQPGVNVKEGNYLLAVNRVPIDTSQDPWAAFQGMANRVITLTVSSRPVLDSEMREVVVKPLASESSLRYRAWIERNRAYVGWKTGGKVGYIYLSDFTAEGLSDLGRQFYGQMSREALIIDLRWNSGGQTPERFLEMLHRPVLHYWAVRYGNDVPVPIYSHQGPKCLLVNGPAGSSGELFPYYFRQKGLGKLIGTRTWGGVIGSRSSHSFIDGGAVNIPHHAFYE